MAMLLNFDIVVVGAGIVGSATACALAKSGLNVALLEARELPDLDAPLTEGVAGYDQRVSALTPASQDFFTRLGVWEAMVSRRVSPYQHMTVWDGDGTARIDFDVAEVDAPALGYIVENSVIASALLKQLQEETTVQMLVGNKLNELQRSAKHWLLTLEGGTQLKTALVIAADGANSYIRQLAGYETREWDYGHHALVATVKTELPHQATAWQRFMPEGPLAFLPLIDADGGQHYSSIVWSTLPDQAEKLIAMDESLFAATLAGALENRLGSVEEVGKRQSFPLRQRHALDYVQPGLALVGDAAHTIHPLAGQGVNLGLQDVACLVEILLKGKQRGIAIGDENLLKRYQRQRKSQNMTMMLAMDGFKRLFEQQAPAMRWVRNAGMSWVDQSALVKRSIIRAAMGLS